MQKISAFCLLSFLCVASAQISIAPSSLNFGDVQVGQTVEKVAYVINNGLELVTMSGVGGGVDAPFTAVQGCQDATIGPGQACEIQFSFTSSTPGSFSAISQGTWNNYPFNISLIATVNPQLIIAPASLDFGIVPVGEILQKGIFITNVGEVDVKLSGVGGGVEAPFDASQNCQDTILSPGDSCEMLFTFTSTGTESATAISSGTWNDLPFNIKVTANTAEVEA